jgi:hypothetical protein
MEIDQVQPTGAQNGYREAFNKLCDVLGAGGLILPDEMVDGLWGGIAPSRLLGMESFRSVYLFRRRMMKPISTIRWWHWWLG